MADKKPLFVSEETHQRVMQLKLQMHAKNVDEVIKGLLDNKE